MRSLLFFAFFITLFACRQNDTGLVENVLADGSKERYERRLDNFAKHGRYQKFHPNGNIAEEAYYQNDVFHGERKLFYSNGTLETLETYQNGRFQGPFRHYYENGVQELELPYVDNQIEGISRAWYPNGVLKETVAFKASEENGSFVEYYENGNLKAEGTYAPGGDGPLEQGELKEYDEQGQLVRKAICTDGLCKTVWKN